MMVEWLALIPFALVFAPVILALWAVYIVYNSPEE
jgi:hypothetical protein